MIINIKNADHAYFLGFITGDGSMYENTRNRGKLSIEISEKDCTILKYFKSLFQKSVNTYLTERTRNTNFKDNYKSCIFTIHNWSFRKELINLGIPYGKKAEIIKPIDNIMKKDYIRGLYDADGSVGLTSQNKPFISLTTKSEYIKEYILDFIEDIISYRPKISRNKRDNIYNIMLMNWKAKKLATVLYKNSNMSLKRKYNLAESIFE